MMRIAAQLEGLDGVTRAALLMGTPANREIMAAAGLLFEDAASATANDLVIAVSAEAEDAADAALALADQLLKSQPAVASAGGSVAEAPPQTLAQAISASPDASLAMISTPGAYATAEAMKALKRGLHVFLFSDNVSVPDEIELKRIARQKNLLVMGPDCGTAILDGVPLGFANAVRRGRIGLIGASGTGLQQVSCLIDRLGEGASQVIGVGGHDLSEAVGGAMMLAAIERLAADPETAVLVLVSKPPAPTVAQRVLSAAGVTGKPVVVIFLGGDPAAIREAGAIAASTLEDAARLAVAVARGRMPVGLGIDGLNADMMATADAARAALIPGQHTVRGLFSGGTLCQEAGLILGAHLDADRFSVVDFGDDEYTVGRPHPMIDFRLRNENIVAAAEDPSTAAILLDIVLGYGSHTDPAEAVRPALVKARAVAEAAGRSLTIVASVCGTDADPQGLARQEAALRAAGVVLAPSSAQAARVAVRVVRDPGACPAAAVGHVTGATFTCDGGH
ncbi:MAG: acyl-CoA synthetase FdrA [Chloroflexi bacterium]|nr:acyl-CoA synthetase FdrA [Chloroflexota bacterium]